MKVRRVFFFSGGAAAAHSHCFTRCDLFLDSKPMVESFVGKFAGAGSLRGIAALWEIIIDLPPNQRVRQKQ